MPSIDNITSGRQQARDRRLFERFPSPFPARLGGSKRNFGDTVVLQDASAQGVKIITQENLLFNTVVSLEVALPDGHDPLILQGKVVRTKGLRDNCWDVGVQFNNIHLMRTARLYQLVFDHNLP